MSETPRPAGGSDSSFGAELRQQLRAKRWWWKAPLIIIAVLLVILLLAQLNALPFVYETF